MTELNAFRGVVILIAALPGIIGPIGGFGGIERLAALFGDEPVGAVPIALRSGLRAILITFTGFGLLAAWSVYALEERKNAFRIVAVAVIVAGLARACGWIVEGPPGALPTVFLAIELGVFPLLLVWHERLRRRAREGTERRAEPGQRERATPGSRSP